MVKLTPGAKIAIIVVILAGAIFTAYKFLGNQSQPASSELKADSTIHATLSVDTTSINQQVVTPTDALSSPTNVAKQNVQVPANVEEVKTTNVVKPVQHKKETSKKKTKTVSTKKTKSTTSSDDNEESNNFVPNY